MKMEEMAMEKKVDDMDKSAKWAKPMSMEDVAECLKNDLMEEIEDCKKYHHMAKIADNAGDEYVCYYLMEMAKDEYTHACFIHEFMERHDMHVHDDHKKCFYELKDKMDELFRS